MNEEEKSKRIRECVLERAEIAIHLDLFEIPRMAPSGIRLTTVERVRILGERYKEARNKIVGGGK